MTNEPCECGCLVVPKLRVENDRLRRDIEGWYEYDAEQKDKIKRLLEAVAWNEKQRDIQAKEMERLRYENQELRDKCQ